MRAHNLCYSTIVLDPKYSNIPGIDYKEIKWEDTNKDTNEVVSHSFTYVQNIQ